MKYFFPYQNGIKLETNSNMKTGKFTNMWKLKNTLLINQWIKEAIKREIKKNLETNERGNMTHQNLWDAVKAVLRGSL